MTKTRNRKRPTLSFQERLRFSADQARSAADSTKKSRSTTEPGSIGT